MAKPLCLCMSLSSCSGPWAPGQDSMSQASRPSNPANPPNGGAPWYRAALPASIGGLLVGLMIVQWMSSSTTDVPPVYVPQKDTAPVGDGKGFTASSFLGSELHAAAPPQACPPIPDCPRCEHCIPCINDDPAGGTHNHLILILGGEERAEEGEERKGGRTTDLRKEEAVGGGARLNNAICTRRMRQGPCGHMYIDP